MAFIKLSSDFKKDSFILLNTTFVTDFMPKANENQIKVYLLGLHYASLDSDVNTLNNFCNDLNLSTTEVKEAFSYWENEGLIKVSNIDNLEIIYLKLDASTAKFKPIDEGKYGDFYVLCQSVLTHELTTSEFKTYVDLIEKDKIEPEALLMIIKYCISIKEKNVPANYILAVAKSWIGEKIFTTKKVEEKIKEIELTSGIIQDLFKVLGIKRNATLEERDMFIKWTKEFKYNNTTILNVAEMLKKKGGMKALDNKLTKYHSLQYFTSEEIESYEKNKHHLNSLAREICVKLGLYIENLEPVIDNYLNNWLYKGYSDETLKVLASYCFKSENNSLEKMDDVIQKLYKQGIVSMFAFEQYMEDLRLIDENIKLIFETLGLHRNVTNRDRELYNTWCNEWEMPKPVLNYAAQISVGKMQPWLYLTKVITNLHEKGIKTVEEAQKLPADYNNINKSNLQMNTRSYSDEELNRLFDNLKEIDF